MNEYEKQAEKFLKDTESEIVWRINGVSDRFESGQKTLEYSFSLKRGDRKYSGLYNSSENDLANFLNCKTNTNQYADLSHLIYKGRIKTVVSKNEWETIIIPDLLIGYRSSINGINLARHTTEKLKAPTSYDLLSCLSMNYMDSIDDYISEFGIEINSAADFKKAEKTFKSIQKEDQALQILYSDTELDALHDIA